MSCDCDLTSVTAKLNACSVAISQYCSFCSVAVVIKGKYFLLAEVYFLYILCTINIPYFINFFTELIIDSMVG